MEQVHEDRGCLDAADIVNRHGQHHQVDDDLKPDVQGQPSWRGGGRRGGEGTACTAPFKTASDLRRAASGQAAAMRAPALQRQSQTSGAAGGRRRRHHNPTQPTEPGGVLLQQKDRAHRGRRGRDGSSSSGNW